MLQPGFTENSTHPGVASGSAAQSCARHASKEGENPRTEQKKTAEPNEAVFLTHLVPGGCNPAEEKTAMGMPRTRVAKPRMGEVKEAPRVPVDKSSTHEGGLEGDRGRE